MPPETVNEPRVPTEVMLGCAAVAKVPVMAPLTFKDPKVPTLVMLGCAAVVSCPLRLVARTVPVVMVLLTVRVLSVPISLMLG